MCIHRQFPKAELLLHALQPHVIGALTLLQLRHALYTRFWTAPKKTLSMRNRWRWHILPAVANILERNVTKKSTFRRRQLPEITTEENVDTRKRTQHLFLIVRKFTVVAIKMAQLIIYISQQPRAYHANLINYQPP